jgi:flagellar hook-basal body complex protein FliE
MDLAAKFKSIPLPPGYGKVPGVPGLEGYVSAGQEIKGASFGQTLSGIINNSNKIIGEPEAMTIESVKTGKVDIHEIMIASGKADVAFKLVTAVTQKIVGAFDKLTSLQV